VNGALIYVLLAAGSVGCAIAAWPGASSPAAPRAWPSLVGLGGLIAALLGVGVESGTPLRHVVQLTPAFVALALAAIGWSLARAAVLPILTFWLGLMAAIWLFLLDVVRLVSGHFTPIEIALTIAVGIACTLGLTGGPRPTAGHPWWLRLVTAVGFAIAQVAALVVSMYPFVSSR